MGIPIFEIASINISATAPTPPPLSFGSLIGVFDHSATANRVDGPYATKEGALVDFSGETEVEAWLDAVFGVGNDLAIREVKIGRIDVGDADLTASLNAIRDEDASPYLWTIESRIKADILETATWIEGESQSKILLAQSADADVKAGTAGNIALDLQTAARNRTALMWNANSDAAAGDEAQHGYRDGAWASQVGHWSLDTHSPPWDFHTLSGQVPDTFSEAEVANIKAANANLYAPVDGFGTASRTWPGKMASGRHIHAQTSIDWIKRRMQEAFVNLKSNEASKGRRVAIDLKSMTAIRATLNGVVEVGYRAGHLDRDKPTRIVLPKLNEISQADLDAGILRFTAKGNLRKSADQFVLDFNVQT